MMFVTLFFGMLSPETGEVLYCNAGHNPPYRVNGGNPRRSRTLMASLSAYGRKRRTRPAAWAWHPGKHFTSIATA